MNDGADALAERPGEVLILCVGNLLCGDDGVGVHVARALERADLPGVRVVDGGTLGLELLPLLGAG